MLLDVYMLFGKLLIVQLDLRVSRKWLASYDVFTSWNEEKGNYRNNT